MERAILKQLDEKVKGEVYFNYNINRCAELDITFRRLYDLYYIVAGANFNLLKAADKELSLDGYEYSNGNVLRFFLRVEYLKSCLLSYNSVEDYVLQIIVFAFKLKGSKISSKSDYNKQCRCNHFDKVWTKKRRHDYKDIYQLSNKYHKKMKRIRDLSNKLKHNNNIQIKELPQPSCIDYTSKEYKSDWLIPKTENLEELIDECYKANAIIVEYISDLYSILDKKYGLDMLNQEL